MKPHYREFAREAVDFVNAWGGGEGAPAIKEVHDYAQSLNMQREPADGQIGWLANAKMHEAPQWPTACVKTLVQAQGIFCKGKWNLRHLQLGNGASLGASFMFTRKDIDEMESTLMPKILKPPTLWRKHEHGLDRALNLPLQGESLTTWMSDS